MSIRLAQCLIPFGLLVFADVCVAESSSLSTTTTESSPTSRSQVICSYAPSQSSVVSHMTAAAGSSAIAAASIAHAVGLTAVLHSSGAYIFTSSTGGFVAGTLGGATALPAIVTVGIVVGGTAATLELLCAPTNHPELVLKIEKAAFEFVSRNKQLVADGAERTLSSTTPFIVESKAIVAKVGSGAFAYANRASVKVLNTYRSTIIGSKANRDNVSCPPLQKAQSKQRAILSTAEIRCLTQQYAVP